MVGLHKCMALVSTFYVISLCYFPRVYLDSKPHGEVKATSASNQSGYQYCINNLNSGQSYDVNIKVGRKAYNTCIPTLTARLHFSLTIESDIASRGVGH